MPRLRKILHSVLISVALYPLVLVGVWALFALGVVAANLQMPTDVMPLVYGLAFAVLTVALMDLLGLASVVMGLVAIANLIEYVQYMVAGAQRVGRRLYRGFLWDRRGRDTRLGGT